MSPLKKLTLQFSKLITEKRKTLNKYKNATKNFFFTSEFKILYFNLYFTWHCNSLHTGSMEGPSLVWSKAVPAHVTGSGSWLRFRLLAPGPALGSRSGSWLQVRLLVPVPALGSSSGSWLRFRLMAVAPALGSGCNKTLSICIHHYAS